MEKVDVLSVGGIVEAFDGMAVVEFLVEELGFEEVEFAMR